MPSSSFPILSIDSKQIETDLGARLPKHFPTSSSSIGPTIAVIQIESTTTYSSPRRQDADLIRDIPEWILTSRPMSRAHVHLISCLLLPIRNALRPLRIRDDVPMLPWALTKSQSHQKPTGLLSRDESLSYPEQLHRWHSAASRLGASTEKRATACIRKHALDPGPVIIPSVYVRILLQMTLDAVGSYFIEHDLSLLNLDKMERQRSEGDIYGPGNGRASGTEVEREPKENALLRMLRRHSAV